VTRTIVVAGATGQQGSWVVKELVRRGTCDVVAFTRRPASQRARALAGLGIRVERGDLSDVASLERIFRGADGVFGVTQPWDPGYRRADIAAEIAQGRAIVDACERAGVGHLVLSTAMRVDDNPTGLPHVDSKLEVERYLRGSGVPYTLLRPGTFMDNIGQPFFPVKNGVVRGFVAGDARLPFVSCRDISVAAAVVFETPERWLGRAVNLMADYVSGNELGATLGRVRRESIRYTAPPAWLMRLFSREFFEMRRGFEKAGRPPYPYRASFDRALEETRRLVGDVWHLEAYFEAVGFGDGRR
jgi:uncharacterized protein YbjT (DUF2867 family)